MLSKAKITYIQALQDKKNRQKNGAFVVEGIKVVEEVLNQERFPLEMICGTAAWAEQHSAWLARHSALFHEVSDKDLERISSQKTPNQVLAVLKNSEKGLSQAPSSIQLCLDGIQDPGNLGTLVRIADWFGINRLYLAEGCADWQNPKALQASMGSFLRVELVQADLAEVWAQRPEWPIYGALLDGQNLYETPIQKPCFLVIGNESKGIQPSLQAKISHPVLIPRIGGAESLNAAVAAGIICAWMQAK